LIHSDSEFIIEVTEFFKYGRIAAANELICETVSSASPDFVTSVSFHSRQEGSLILLEIDEDRIEVTTEHPVAQLRLLKPAY
jgi:hypothetical protein